MKLELAHLLAGSTVCLLGLILSFSLLMREQKRMRQRALCIEKVASQFRSAHAAAGSAGYRLDLEQHKARLADRLAAVVRYDQARKDLYLARPTVVLLFAVVPAALLSRLLVDYIGPIGWLSVPAILILFCRRFYVWCDARHGAQLFKQLPDALAMIVRAVRVGLPMVEALRVVARESPQPTAREFAALVAQTSIGVPLETALRDMAERNRLPEYRFFATALSLQSQTGGGLAETLENLGETIRRRLAARLRGHALAAEARMSSYVLGALPIVTGTILSIINPTYMAVLFDDPGGRKLLLTAVGLLGSGALTMRTMIRKSLT